MAAIRVRELTKAYGTVPAVAGVSFEVLFDLRDHMLRARAADGRELSFALHDGLSVAEFYRRLHEGLQALGVDVPIIAKPYGVPMTTPVCVMSAREACLARPKSVTFGTRT